MFQRVINAIMPLGDDYDDYDDYDDDEDLYDDVEEEHDHKLFKKNSSDDSSEKKSVLNRPSEKETRSQRSVPKITPMRNKGKGNGVMEVCVIKPSSFDDAKEISETLLADRTVLLNMRGLNLAIAQRIIDFTCGTCYAIDGNLQRVDDCIFIITPAGVELSGDLADLVDAFDFTGIQTAL